MLGHLDVMCIDLWKENWMVYEALNIYVLKIELCKDVFVSHDYAKFKMVNKYEWFRMKWIQWSVALPLSWNMKVSNGIGFWMTMAWYL